MVDITDKWSREREARSADRARDRPSLGQVLQLHGDAVAQVEALYEEQSGEVTEATQEAEQARDLAAEDALEQLARYHRWTTDQLSAAAVEQARLDNFKDGMLSRQGWAEERMTGLVRARDPRAKSRRAGTLQVKLRDSARVVAPAELDLAKLPPTWLRDVQGKPAVPDSVALDKAKAKKDLVKGYQVGEPPGPGWYECSSPRGLNTLYLFQGAVTGKWRLAHEHNGERPADSMSLERANLTVTGAPGRHSLRWRHHAPGVELVLRVGVTVG